MGGFPTLPLSSKMLAEGCFCKTKNFRQFLEGAPRRPSKRKNQMVIFKFHTHFEGWLLRPAFFLIFLIHGLTGVQGQPDAFIRVEGTHLIRDGRPYYFIGANFWYGMFLGSEGEGGNRERLVRELDRLQALGIDNLRIMAGSEGPPEEPWRMQPALQNRPGKYDRDLLKGLDFLLVEMGKRDMKAVMVLNNFFQWSGGMAQYVSWATGKAIPYPHLEGHNWDEFQRFSAEFYGHEKAQTYFRKFIKKLINRRNTISKKRYRNDPIIMAWQLANEPRGFGQGEAYLRWVDETAAYIQELDENHLVSLGGEGKTFSDDAGTDFERVSRSEHLDYLTAHLWAENWSWYNPRIPETFEPALENAIAYLEDHVAIAQQLQKPIVFEEFGISRDSLNHDPSAPVTYRDRFFDSFFEKILGYASQNAPLVGCNFWCWSGEGRPARPGGFWKKGDALTGDPPHETQGWYSVYLEDESTLQIIRAYNEKIRGLCPDKTSSQ